MTMMMIAQLALAADVDFERRRLYSYRVVATDAGQPRLTAASELHVEILDVDDELPHFDVAQYRFRISENRPIGTCVSKTIFTPQKKLKFAEKNVDVNDVFKLFICSNLVVLHLRGR